MSINDNETVDSVIRGVNYEDVILLIVDHMDCCNTTEHILLLQKKFNTYIKFVE